MIRDQLNAVTTRDVYPLPRIEDALSRLEGTRYFSIMDMQTGYWQVGLNEKDKEKTAFVTADRLYQFRVMPFRLSNAPATFQRMMDVLIPGIKWNTCLIYEGLPTLFPELHPSGKGRENGKNKKFKKLFSRLSHFSQFSQIALSKRVGNPSLIYLDDIVIFSQTIPKHLSRLETVLLRFREAGLKLKLSKCSFLATYLKVLGYIVSGVGLSPDPAKIEAVQNFPVPSTRLKDVQSFIGLCSYYRKFICNFAVLARPLTNLTRKNTPFHWTDEHQSSFDALKNALLSPPILGHPNSNLPMEIHCDACGFGLGAVLVQRQEGAERVISYASRLMNRAESNYSVSEQECLALIFALDRLKSYLWGMKVLVLTDHHALCWLMKKKSLVGRLARWSLQLQDLDLEIVHRSGCLHSRADALSRNRVAPPEDTPEIPLLSLQTIDKESIKAEQEMSGWWRPIILGLREKEPTNLTRKLIQHYEIREGLLYHRVIKNGRAYYRLCLIPSLVEAVLLACHDDTPSWGYTNFR
ncbi:Uncharacterized protein APZ42_025415 [Daphnia magna]|uniref:RNA-directed DNA polymerase n=1 Tax=Daphnia magna TaxID=35525 RepID=A0A162DD84_9CRUS|nr:Uncharacterized protein APZ42_025415 [Daphnia magna]